MFFGQLQRTLPRVVVSMQLYSSSSWGTWRSHGARHMPAPSSSRLVLAAAAGSRAPLFGQRKGPSNQTQDGPTESSSGNSSRYPRSSSPGPSRVDRGRSSEGGASFSGREGGRGSGSSSSSGGRGSSSSSGSSSRSSSSAPWKGRGRTATTPGRSTSPTSAEREERGSGKSSDSTYGRPGWGRDSSSSSSSSSRGGSRDSSRASSSGRSSGGTEGGDKKNYGRIGNMPILPGRSPAKYPGMYMESPRGPLPQALQDEVELAKKHPKWSPEVKPRLVLVDDAASNLSLISNTTLIPRDPTISDGPWNQKDQQLVVTAQQEAAAAAVLRTPAAALEAAAAAALEKGETVDPMEKYKGLVLLGLGEEELRKLARDCNLQGFRGTQIYQGLAKGETEWGKIPGLPDKDAAKLQARGIVMGRSKVYTKVKASDGTVKLLLQLPDFRLVETVGIPADGRLTTCVSSQVGCPMRCTFCATGKGGFARNLKAHEIIDQVLHVQTLRKRRVSHVVFMGMGEPLLNLPAVIPAVRYLQDTLGMSGRNITISTVGVPNALRKLAEAHLTATLAVSIHAPNQALREQLIPSAKAYPLEALLEDCAEYFQATKRRVSFEYTLMAGVNDAPEHAAELAAVLRRYDMASHVNVIQWNPVDESEYKRPDKTAVRAFMSTLENAGMAVTFRTTRGMEAAAACGQLRNQHQKEVLPEQARMA